MPRFLTGNRLVIATHNKGKLSEFKDLLAPYGVDVTSAGELGLAEPEETGQSFFDNALIKAQAAMQATGLPALADDSGLCVNGLGGAPGLYSVRWCGPERAPQVGMDRIKTELADNPDTSAYFISALVLLRPDGPEQRIEGRCDGHLVWPPRGELGHGFDPWFQPEGESRTFGEMTLAEKQSISHRGRAMQKLLALFAVA